MSHNLKLLPRALIFLVSGFIASPLNPSIAQTTEEAGLMKLMRRMLSLNSDTKVIVGKLPEKILVKLPIPSQSQIVGSTTDNKGSIRIVLDSSQSVEKITNFYTTQLKNSGWEQQANNSTGGGFVVAKLDSIYYEFCKKDSNPMYLGLSIQETKKTPSTISLSVGPIDKKDKYHPCKQSTNTEFISVSGMNFGGLLPILIPPLNTEVSEVEEYLHNQSVVILKTKLDGKTLANHYIPQLDKAGWKKIDSGESDSFTWSNWTFKDNKGQNRNGILSFTKIQGKPNHYFASLKVLKIQ
ncbi:MAG: hypothetical protein AAFV71_32280 [Cyanobacteria bacterium J06633_8]